MRGEADSPAARTSACNDCTPGKIDTLLALDIVYALAV